MSVFLNCVRVEISCIAKDLVSFCLILTLTSQRLEAGHCGISRRGGDDEIDWDLVLMEYLLR